MNGTLIKKLSYLSLVWSKWRLIIYMARYKCEYHNIVITIPPNMSGGAPSWAPTGTPLGANLTYQLASAGYAPIVQLADSGLPYWTNWILTTDNSVVSNVHWEPTAYTSFIGIKEV